MEHILILTFVFFLAFLFSEAAMHAKLPPSIGQLLAGFLFAIPVVKQDLFSPVDLGFLEVLSNLGIIFLMLLTGLEISLKRLIDTERDSLIIGIAGVAVPFLLGMSLTHYLLGYGWLASLVVGLALSVSAEGTTVNVLMEVKKLSTKIGSIIVGSGLVDDLLVVLALPVLAIFLQNGKFGLVEMLFLFLRLAFFVCLIFVAVRYIPVLVKSVEKEHSDVSLFKSTLLIGLGLAILSEIAGFSSIAGALIAGILLKKSLHCCPSHQHQQTHELQALTLGFIVPFFFVFTGMHIDYLAIWNHWPIVLAIVSIAMFGKILGVLLAKPFTDITWRQSYVVGWSLNSRGVIELVIAEIARGAGLITSEVYSAIVITSVITTFLFPFFLKREIGKYPKVMTARGG